MRFGEGIIMEFMLLEDCCEILDSLRIPITASDREKGIYPYYGANGIQDYVSSYIFDDDLVLLAEDGGSFGSKTKPIAYRVSGKCWVNNHAHVLKPKEGMDVDFLCYSLMFYNTDGLVNGATRQKLTQSAMRKMKIPKLHIDVQQNIVKEIKYVKSIIEIRGKQLEKLSLLVKARFVESFGEIEEICNVDYYIKELIAGKSLAGEVECKNKVLKTGAVSFDYFDKNQTKNLPLDYEPKKEHLVCKGDIIISRMNTAELTGATAYVWDISENVYIPDRLWKAVIREGVNSIFVWNMLIQTSTKEQILKKCSGTSGSMKNISKAGMLGIKVKKVDNVLQDKFGTFVEEVYKSKFPNLHNLKSIYTKPQLCCKMVVVNDFLNTKRF